MKAFPSFSEYKYNFKSETYGHDIRALKVKKRIYGVSLMGFHYVPNYWSIYRSVIDKNLKMGDFVDLGQYENDDLFITFTNGKQLR